jgi:hypothetical protein
MPVIVGLILTPVGAVVATCVFLVIVSAERAGIADLTALFQIGQAIAPYGLLYGSQFIAPVTLAVLPVTYAPLRRRSRLGIGTLALVGLLSALLLMWGIILYEQIGGGDIPFFTRRTLNFSVVAVAAGLVVGIAFAYIMRWIRPSDWPVRRQG